MLLYMLILLPLLTSIFILCIQDTKWGNTKNRLKVLSLYSAILSFFFSINLWIRFDKLTGAFQYVPEEPIKDIFDFDLFSPQFFAPGQSYDLHKSYLQGLNMYSVGLDGVSLFFVVLTAFVTVSCVLLVWRRQSDVGDFLAFIFLIEFFLMVVFATLDLLIFYMFFESVLMPMFIIIGVWGSNYEGRVKASYYFFLYTLLGSTLMLLALIIIFLEVGTTHFLVLLDTDFSLKKQLILWLFTFFGFAVKIPMLPIHIWLPEAHVEAPTEGSVILASLLLKLGGYGFLRVSVPMFPYASQYFTPLVSIFGVLGVIYGSLTTIRQIDLKKIIAYSSVAHMNLVVLGIFSGNHHGLQGAIFLMLAHGIVSGALFFLIGALYDRHHTRSIAYYGGLAQVMPLYSFYLLFFLLANMSFPGTCSFIGEFLILVGIFQKNIGILFLAATGVVLSAAYSIWVFNRLCFGNLKWRREAGVSGGFGLAKLLKWYGAEYGKQDFSLFWYGIYGFSYLKELGMSKQDLADKYGRNLWICNSVSKGFSFNRFRDLSALEGYLLTPYLLLTLWFGLMPGVILDCTYAAVKEVLREEYCFFLTESVHNVF